MRRLSVVLILLLAALSACKGGEPSYTVLRKGGWRGRPPEPRGEVILTLITPDGKSYDLDRAGLARLTWVRRVTRYHPEEKGPPASFEGVLLSQIISELGIAEKGLRVRFSALDDYQLERPWSQLKPYEPILALRQDGKPLTMDNYGPLRVILPYERLKPDPTEYNALWVWQLRRIYFHY